MSKRSEESAIEMNDDDIESGKRFNKEFVSVLLQTDKKTHKLKTMPSKWNAEMAEKAKNGEAGKSKNKYLPYLYKHKDVEKFDSTQPVSPKSGKKIMTNVGPIPDNEEDRNKPNSGKNYVYLDFIPTREWFTVEGLSNALKTILPKYFNESKKSGITTSRKEKENKFVRTKKEGESDAKFINSISNDLAKHLIGRLRDGYETLDEDEASESEEMEEEEEEERVPGSRRGKKALKKTAGSKIELKKSAIKRNNKDYDNFLRLPIFVQGKTEPGILVRAFGNNYRGKLTEDAITKARNSAEEENDTALIELFGLSGLVFRQAGLPPMLGRHMVRYLFDTYGYHYNNLYGENANRDFIARIESEADELPFSETDDIAERLHIGGFTSRRYVDAIMDIAMQVIGLGEDPYFADKDGNKQESSIRDPKNKTLVKFNEQLKTFLLNMGEAERASFLESNKQNITWNMGKFPRNSPERGDIEYDDPPNKKQKYYLHKQKFYYKPRENSKKASDYTLPENFLYVRFVVQKPGEDKRNRSGGEEAIRRTIKALNFYRSWGKPEEEERIKKEIEKQINFEIKEYNKSLHEYEATKKPKVKTDAGEARVLALQRKLKKAKAKAGAAETSEESKVSRRKRARARVSEETEEEAEEAGSEEEEAGEGEEKSEGDQETEEGVEEEEAEPTESTETETS